MRLSLKELMVVVTFAAVGCAALKYASSSMLLVMQALTGLVLVGMLVTAVVDRGGRQAFAIGFTAVAMFYGLVLVCDNKAGAGFWNGAFGTKRAAAALHEAIVTYRWRNQSSQELHTGPLLGISQGESQMYRWEPTSAPPGRLAAAPDDGPDGEEQAGGIRPDEEHQALAEKLRQEIEAAGFDPSGTVTPVRSAIVAGNRRSGRRGLGATRIEQVNFFMDLVQMDDSQRQAFVAREPERALNLARVMETWNGMDFLSAELLGYEQVWYKREQVPWGAHLEWAAVCLWTLLLGYVGGLFGRFVYGRRSEEVRK